MRIWYSLESSGKRPRTSSICFGKTLTPLIFIMSSLRPVMTSMRGNRLPQGQVPGMIRERSWVRKRMRGAPSLTRVVMTISPGSPSGTFSPVTGSMTSR